MRISDWSSDVCSSDLLFDSGRHALYDFPFFTDVDDTRADTSAKLPQFRDSFLVAIFTPPPDNHIGAGAGEPASKTQADARVTPGHERNFSSQIEQIFCHIFRSEEHTSELQSLMRTSYAVFCL